MATIYTAFPKPLTKQAALTESFVTSKLRLIHTPVANGSLSWGHGWPLPQGYRGDSEGIPGEAIPGTFRAKRRRPTGIFLG